MTTGPPRDGPICFDLDGCLIDATPGITAAIAAALDRLGVPAPPPAELTWCVGPPLKESMAHLLSTAEHDPARADEAVDVYRAIYARTWPQGTRIVGGIEVVLSALADDGRPMAVVTSKPRPLATIIVQRTGLARWCTEVHGPAPDRRTEGKADTLARALGQGWPDAEPAAATMVGDRRHDVVAGRECGTATVGVTWGAGTREELEGAGADHVVDVPQELAAVLRGPATL